jgi:hypothetical protein
MLTGHSGNRSSRDKRGFYDATLLLPCSSQPFQGRGRCLNCIRIAHKVSLGQKNPAVYTAKSGRLRNIITQPVTGYELSYLAGIGVLLSVDYVDNPRQLETKEARRVQLALTPKKAQQLGASLQRVANRFLKPPPGTKDA